MLHRCRLPGPGRAHKCHRSPANGTRALADALPDTRYQTLAGQNHMVKPQAIAPVLTEFFRTTH